MTKLQTPLLIIAVFLLLFANLGFWLSRTLYNPQKFSDIVTKVYEQQEVRNAIAANIVDDALASKPIVNQVLADPIQQAIAGILGSQPFKVVLQKVSVRLQNYLTTNNRQDVTIEIGQLASIIKSAGTAISPELGAQIPDTVPQTVTLIKSDSLPNINKWLKPIMVVAPFAGIVSLLILVYLFYIAENRTKFFKKTSIFFLVGIFLFGLLIPYFRILLQGNTSSQNVETIVTATYNAFANVLIVQLAILAVIFIFIYLGAYTLGLEKKSIEGIKKK